MESDGGIANTSDVAFDQLRQAIGDILTRADEVLAHWSQVDEVSPRALWLPGMYGQRNALANLVGEIRSETQAFEERLAQENREPWHELREKVRAALVALRAELLRQPVLDAHVQLPSLPEAGKSELEVLAAADRILAVWERIDTARVDAGASPLSLESLGTRGVLRAEFTRLWSFVHDDPDRERLLLAEAEQLGHRLTILRRTLLRYDHAILAHLATDHPLLASRPRMTPAA